MDFYTAWWFLVEHRIFNNEFDFERIWIHVTKVNPATNAVDDDRQKNTKVAVWLECFPDNENVYGRFHDVDLDCGGDTFEDAIITLAGLVKEKYGD